MRVSTLLIALYRQMAVLRSGGALLPHGEGARRVAPLTDRIQRWAGAVRYIGKVTAASSIAGA